MAAQRKTRAPAIQRRRARRPGVGLAVGGCVLFGVGVLVGAFLGPMARPKRAASPPETTRVLSSAVPSKKTASKETRSRDRATGKSDQLTFFETLKEGPPRAGETFVPFKPTGEAPPPLEAMVPEKATPVVAKLLPVSPPKTARPKGVRPSRGYFVQVAAFQYKENARRLTQELRRQGYRAKALTDRNAPKPHQVRVGPYESRKEAALIGRRLQKKLLYPTLVIREPERRK